MAAYWRSPYREMTSSSFRSPDHSTLKFEQSLYLSRSRTSINNSPKFDWLDAAFGSPSPNIHRRSDLTRSNTNIKSILKTPKRDGSSLFPGKHTDSNSSGESNNANGDSLKKNDSVKKRVTFGGTEDLEGDIDSIQTQNKKCQLKAIKRISHSRLLEESAMKKLNRLIGGGATMAENTTLPSVKGTGLLSSLRHSADTARLLKSACSHSAELRCIRCIRKDVETDHDDRVYGKATGDGKLVSKSNNPLQSRDNTIHNEINDSTQKIQGNGNDWSAREQMNKDNEENVCCQTPPYNFNREEVSYRISNLSTTSASNNSKKHFRLLPGRYPFTTGAMQIKKLSIPDIQKAQRGNSAITTEKTNVVDLHHDKTSAKQNGATSKNNNNEVLQRINPGGTAGAVTPDNRANTSVFPHSTTAVVNNDSGYTHTIEKGIVLETAYDDSDDENKDNNNRKLPNDKTSDILDWLNDVHQKRTFKPRVSRFYTSPES